MRSLIVNADDFGQTAGINRGVIQAHQQGVVTSASLMVRGDFVEDAAEYARDAAGLSLGLHVDLGEWVFCEGEWQPLYEVADADDVDAVSRELAYQLDAFHSLTGASPTHLDSHQHAHRSEPLRSLLLSAGRELDVPVRGFHERIKYSGDFYGMSGKGDPYPQGITVEALIALIGALPCGITELGCHPGYAAGDPLVYGLEREVELEALCDPTVARVLTEEGIALTNFALLDIVQREGRASGK